MAALALSYDDVMLLPASSFVLPHEVELKTRLTKKLLLNIPLVSAAMDTVTENQAAVALAQQGGIGIIHKNNSVQEQCSEIQKVKLFESWLVKNPIALSSNDSLEKAWKLKETLQFSSFPVVQGKKLVGIATRRDFLFENNPRKKVSEIMTRKVVCAPFGISSEKAQEIMHKNRIEKLPLVNEKKELVGLITLQDLEKKQVNPNAVKDSEGRLLVGAAIGPNDEERAIALAKAGADVLILDTSHGHSQGVVNACKKFKRLLDIPIIAGNVATAKAVEDLHAAEADAIKVGIGGGSICTTRVITGVGVPQFSAVLECSKQAKLYDLPVIADGGVRYSGDITKAIAAGADSVMIGSLFAGCEETPGKIVYLSNRKFKQYRGMGSLGAMQKNRGAKERYFQGTVQEKRKLVPEGIEGVVPYKGKLSEVVFQLLGGLRAGMGLTGSATIADLRSKTQWVQITGSGLHESHPHDVLVTEEAPNYQKHSDG